MPYLTTTEADSAEAEAQVKSWGFKRVVVWQDLGGEHYPAHSHEGVTTHLILKGGIHISYPDDEKPSKQFHGPGARVDVEAERSHEVWIPKDGCIMIVGE